jgi:AraC family transcriptional regulator
MSELDTRTLLTTASVTIRDVHCTGTCRYSPADEHASATHLVFPYRGLFIRHLGRDQAVAEANQLLFFNTGDGYRVSHPVAGGDASLDVVLSEPLLREVAPRTLVDGGATVSFRTQRVRIDPRAQAMAAALRHRLRRGDATPLEAESLALHLVRRALGPRTAHTPGSTAGRRRIVDRTKVVLASNVTRRWTLSALGAEVGHSPVYLTQVFQQVEGLPLYRYHLRLRLARALDRLADSGDLTTLGLDLGFSSHSHFTTAFRQMYGQSPSAFRVATRVSG